MNNSKGFLVENVNKNTNLTNNERKSGAACCEVQSELLGPDEFCETAVVIS